MYLCAENVVCVRTHHDGIPQMCMVFSLWVKKPCCCHDFQVRAIKCRRCIRCLSRFYQNTICDIIIFLILYAQTTNLNAFCIVVTRGHPCVHPTKVCNYDLLIAFACNTHTLWATSSEECNYRRDDERKKMLFGINSKKRHLSQNR